MSGRKPFTPNTCPAERGERCLFPACKGYTWIAKSTSAANLDAAMADAGERGCKSITGLYEKARTDPAPCMLS